MKKLRVQALTFLLPSTYTGKFAEHDLKKIKS